MKINTPYFVINVEILLLIVFLISILSEKVRFFLSSFYICYLFIVFHELSHMLVGAIVGKEFKQFNLSLSGVCVSFKDKKYNTSKETKYDLIKDIFVYMAGPLSNVIMAILFKNVKIIFEINIFFALLNLIPLYPLDGYNLIITLFKLIGIKDNYTKIVIDIFENILLLILTVLSLAQIVILRNPSMVIFIIYVIIQKKQRENSDKNAEILRNIAY